MVITTHLASNYDPSKTACGKPMPIPNRANNKGDTAEFCEDCRKIALRLGNELVNVDHAIAVLNRIHQADPTVLSALIEYRIPCSKDVANDPTVQVATRNGDYAVGFLGILNGIFGIREDGWGFICAVVDDDGNMTGFERTTHGAYTDE